MAICYFLETSHYVLFVLKRREFKFYFLKGEIQKGNVDILLNHNAILSMFLKVYVSEVFLFFKILLLQYEEIHVCICAGEGFQGCLHAQHLFYNQLSKLFS
jgi:hypothetical protein